MHSYCMIGSVRCWNRPTVPNRAKTNVAMVAYDQEATSTIFRFREILTERHLP